MQKLIRNPIFRIVGAMLILYYGLLNNKNQPNSLANRLAPEKIMNNLSEASSKSIDIIDNLNKAEALKKSLNNPNEPQIKDAKKNQEQKNRQ